MKNKVLLVIFSISTTVAVIAQRTAPLTGEGIRSTWYNPASAGTYNKRSIQAHARDLWESPTQSENILNLAADFKCIEISRNSGGDAIGFGTLGLRYHFDSYGILSSQSFQTVMNAQFRLKNTFLSIGVAPGVQRLSFNEDIVFPGQTVPQTPGSETRFTMDGGIQWFGKRFTLGLASQYLNGANYTGIFFERERHYHAYADYALSIGSSWDIRTRITGRMVQDFYTLEGMAYVHYASVPVYIGLGMRNRSTLLFGVYGRLQNFSLGYFTDYTTSPLTNSSFRSHEVRLTYALFDEGLFNIFDSNRGISSF